MKRITMAILAATSLTIAGCGQPSSTAPGPVKQDQAQKAAEAANSIQYSENAEIENIKRRLELTSNPGQIGFILLMNEMGQPVMYASVKGKVTSGAKRLTAPEQRWSVDTGEWQGEQLGSAPSDEGTWGNSGEYIFFWTVDGQYIQWNGKYMYSDKPFRTSIQPLVLNVK